MYAIRVNFWKIPNARIYLNKANNEHVKRQCEVGKSRTELPQCGVGTKNFNFFPFEKIK